MHAESTMSPAPDTRTLGELIASVARRTPDAALVVCAAVGILGVTVTGLLLRSVWWLTPILLGTAAFGAWGIADRERGALGRRAALFRFVRVLATLVGAAAAAFTAVILFALVVGPLIS